MVMIIFQVFVIEQLPSSSNVLTPPSNVIAYGAMNFIGALDPNGLPIIPMNGAVITQGGITVSTNEETITLPQSNKPFFVDAALNIAGLVEVDDDQGFTVNFVQAGTNNIVPGVISEGRWEGDGESATNLDLKVFSTISSGVRSMINTNAGPLDIQLKVTTENVDAGDFAIERAGVFIWQPG